MSEAEPQSSTTEPKLRWYQYTLRTLLGFVTLCAVPCSWVAVKIREAKRQRDAVTAIKKLGGDVRCESWLGLTTVTEVDFRGNVIGDEDLACLESLPRLQTLRLSSTFVTDTGLARLRNMAALRELDLTSLNITDDGLTHLMGLTQLAAIELRDTEVTEAGVSKLKAALPKCIVYWEPPTEAERRSGLKGDERRRVRIRQEAIDAIAKLGGEVEVVDDKLQKAVRFVRLRGAKITDDALWVLGNLADDLRIVDLCDSKITDEGLRNLRLMPQLEAINLQNTQVSDAGLAHLYQLPQLKALNLENTHVTGIGVEKLQQTFRNCKVTWTPPTKDERY